MCSWTIHDLEAQHGAPSFLSALYSTVLHSFWGALNAHGVEVATSLTLGGHVVTVPATGVLCDAPTRAASVTSVAAQVSQSDLLHDAVDAGSAQWHHTTRGVIVRAVGQVCGQLAQDEAPALEALPENLSAACAALGVAAGSTCVLTVAVLRSGRTILSAEVPTGSLPLAADAVRVAAEANHDNDRDVLAVVILVVNVRASGGWALVRSRTRGNWS